jgi:uncharacterized protein
MEFEYDPSKSRLNELKHGISFDEAKALWDDPDAYIAPTKTTGEERFLIVGEIEGKGWTAVITFRGETIRIISVRRSRTREIEEYDHNKRIR